MNEQLLSNPLISNTVSFIAIASSIIWFSAKIFIRKNGLEAHWLSNHKKDLKSLYTLWKGDFPVEVQTKAKFHLIFLITGFLSMFAFFLAMVLSSPDVL